MGPLSYKRSVVDRNVVTRRIPVVCQFLGPLHVAAGSAASAAIPGCVSRGPRVDTWCITNNSIL